MTNGGPVILTQQHRSQQVRVGYQCFSRGRPVVYRTFVEYSSGFQHHSIENKEAFIGQLVGVESKIGNRNSIFLFGDGEFSS